MRISSSSPAAFVVLLLVIGIGCADGDGGTADDAEVDAGPDELAEYEDPGVGEWELGTPEYCKMDPTMFNDDSAIDRYAVFRYGKLCHMKGDDTPVAIYSVTKTLGAVMAGRASFLAREVERTGPGTGPILHTDLGSDWIAEPKYSHPETTINHIMAMVAFSPSLADADLWFQYDAMGSGAINGMIEATEKCAGQVPGLPRDAVAFVQQEIFDRMGMTNSIWDPMIPTDPALESLDPEFLATLDLFAGIGIGWTANLSDMGRFGTLLLHDGWYGGERLLSQQWVYRMSHPAFESASISYGQLTWLNHRGNAAAPVLVLLC
jgi:hypothetical protein